MASSNDSESIEFFPKSDPPAQAAAPPSQSMDPSDESSPTLTAAPDEPPPLLVQQQQDIQRRSLALDALRGLAILMMCLSGILPRIPGDPLPGWMFHAQVPPPDYKFIPTQPGITWVDLVFPMFLFAMGVAFPFALQRRLEKGHSPFSLIPSILNRGLLLAAFAIYLAHVHPFSMSRTPELRHHLMSIVCFLALFPIFLRIPDPWVKKAPEAWRRYVVPAIRAIGVVIVFIVLKNIEHQSGKGFSIGRNDIIILVLANVAVTGSLVWLFTRNSLVARLLVLAMVYPLWKSNDISGSWVNVVLSQWPNQLFLWLTGQLYPITDFICRMLIGDLPREELVRNLGFIYNFSFQKYLYIVVPGTIVGDLLLAWMRGERPRWAASPILPWAKPWSKLHLHAIAALMVAVHLLLLWGLFARNMTWGVDESAWVLDTVLISFFLMLTLIGVIFWLMRHPSNQHEALLRDLVLWGTYFLIIGYFFEPMEGGIKKDHSYMSYYFVTSGLAIYLLVALIIWIDLMRNAYAFGILIANGQNPMIAYIGIRTILAPMLGMAILPFGVSEEARYISLNTWVKGWSWMANSPWNQTLWAFVSTMMLAVIVWGITKAKLIWRT